MENLEKISGHYQELTEEEREAARWLKEDFPILSVIKGLTLEEKRAVYLSIKRKPDCMSHFSALQRRWLSEHEVYLDEELKRKQLDHSHEAINRILTTELSTWTGENIRFRIYYALKYSENIEQPYSPELSALLEEVQRVRRLN